MNENVDGMMIRLVGLALAVLLMAGMTIYTGLFPIYPGRPCSRRGRSVERLR